MFNQRAGHPANSQELVWGVGALCKAIAETLESRLNPVTVRGELSGFSRAASGHCYFSIKDEHGQLRCAMFRRQADGLGFAPQNGDLVQLQGRLGVYESRGDLQLIVEHMQPAGVGALFEQFMRLKASLEAQGLFDTSRKRALTPQPRGIAVVTSLGAAALHDIVTALKRRVPHIPVVVVPALVQGSTAAQSMVQALETTYQLVQASRWPSPLGPENPQNLPCLDVIILARGGGSLEDLWPFNDARLARTIASSPVPVISGVGHETDFTIADFCADVRAPTPTAAAELVAPSRDTWLAAMETIHQRMLDATHRCTDHAGQRLDYHAARLGRPSAMITGQAMRLMQLDRRMRHGLLQQLQAATSSHQRIARQWMQATHQAIERSATRLERAQLQLELLNPQCVMQRGYAIVRTPQGHLITQAMQAQPGDRLLVTLMDGEMDVTVSHPRLI